MRRPKSPHGTARRYWSGCRCADCLTAHNDYCRANHRAKRGNPVVDAGEVRAHLVALQEQGVYVDAVALETGISRRDLIQLRNGRKANLRKKRADDILAVGPSAAERNGEVPAGPTVKRLRRILRVLTQRQVGERLGLKSKIHLPRADVVRASNARRIRLLYGEVILRPRRVNTSSDTVPRTLRNT